MQQTDVQHHFLVCFKGKRVLFLEYAGNIGCNNSGLQAEMIATHF